MRAWLVLLTCLVAADSAAARVYSIADAKAAAATLEFLPAPDKVDLLKQVTDPQLDGETQVTHCVLDPTAAVASQQPSATASNRHVQLIHSNRQLPSTAQPTLCPA
jgi:hypothetical protein